VHQLFTELLDQATHASETHFLELKVMRNDNLEHLSDQGLNNLLQDEQLIVNNVLPDLRSLSTDFFHPIVLQDEHGGENLVLHVHAHILGLSFDHIVLEFFHKLVHER